MMNTRTLLTLTAVLMLCAGGAPALRADQLDIRGNWQVNIYCLGGAATTTSFLEIEEDLSTGALTATIPNCGTLEVPPGIRRLATCESTPHPLVGQVSGTSVDIPPAGFFTWDTTPETPVFIACYEPVARIVSEEHYDAVITDDGMGTGVRISGILRNGRVEFYDSSGTLCYVFPNAPDCQVEMKRNDVAEGTNVAVAPLDGATVTFSAVNAAGTAAVTPLTDPEGSVPANFQVLGNGGFEIFYDVTTTASIAGAITSCFSYPDANSDGTVDGTDPPVDEGDLKVLHEEGGVFVDQTVSLDPVNNEICAQTTSLSQFLLGGEYAPGTTTTTTATTTTTLPPGQQMKEGKLFLVKNPRASDPTKRKIVYKVKERASSNTIVGNPTLDGAKLKIRLDANTDCYDMPASGWSAIGTIGFKYRDSRGNHGPVKVASIKKTPSGNFLIKAIIMGRNGPITVVPPDPGTQGDTNLRLGGGDQYCSTFGGTIKANNAKIFKAKKALAPAGCNVTACSPSGAFVDVTTTALD